ncbi:MAG TPA: DUF1015 domain-containing protein [Candidatus Cybelea sp.]|jgi:uncharacterized protein (DUF1015 family)|nr:DUF1015 domain-containing protein [Candidatus Cybelea sp.]
MAEIQPFRAYRYDTKRVALNDVLTQPYDKITPAMQDGYYAASPYNLIAIEKGRVLPTDAAGNNVYTRAASQIEKWIAERILIQDAAPAIYVYSQDFQVPGTQVRRVRIGFIALTRVVDYQAEVVFRHEHTLSGPKADRIELLRQTRAQTGQLFLLYDDRLRQIDTWLEQIARTPALDELVDEFGVTHRLWPVSDPDFAARIQKSMADKKLVIADGHHRYETALKYRDECRKRSHKVDPMAASEFAMATFINTHSRGLTILATHRLVSRLANFDFDRFRNNLAPLFDWYSYPFGGPEERSTAYVEFRKDLERPNHGRRAIGVYPGSVHSGASAFYLFALRPEADLEALLPDVSEAQRALDVVLLHRLILEKGLGITAEAVASEQNLSYEREIDRAIAEVDDHRAQLAFLLNPVRVEQVTKIALGGDVMPQKSTDFYPKLLSGIAMYRIEG